MAGTNDFLTFAGGAGSNTLTQAQYAALTTLLANGFQSGTAQSNQLNKVWRQSSIMAAVLGQLVADATGQNATDDGTIATLEANLARAMRGDIWTSADTSSTANAYAITLAPAPISLVPGMVVSVENVHASNTGATTLNVNAFGALPVVYPGGSALVGGELSTNQSFIARLNRTATAWILVWVSGGSFDATPAQFDNSTKAATTEFVQRALGNMHGFVAVSSNTTLTAAQAGSYVTSNAGSGAVSCSLPLISSVPAGTMFVVSHSSSSMTSFGLVTSGTDLLVFDGLSIDANPYAMSYDETVIVISTGVVWKVVASNAAKFLNLGGAFGSSLAANGYQKLPSGLIIQWGAFTTSSSATTNVAFPIAFPNAVRSIVISPNSTGPNFTTYTNAVPASFNADTWTTAGARAVIGNTYIAVGN